MRYAIRIRPYGSTYLAALQGDHPTFTPFRIDACSFRQHHQASRTAAALLALGFLPEILEVAQ